MLIDCVSIITISANFFSFLIVSSRYIYFPHMQPSSEFFSCLQKIDSFQFKWMRKIFLVDGAVKHMQNVVRESFSGHRI